MLSSPLSSGSSSAASLPRKPPFSAVLPLLFSAFLPVVVDTKDYSPSLASVLSQLA